MPEPTLYRIDYTITRRLAGEDDFTEYGWGGTGGNESIEAAVYEAQSDIQNGLYVVTTDPFSATAARDMSHNGPITDITEDGGQS